MKNSNGRREGIVAGVRIISKGSLYNVYKQNQHRNLANKEIFKHLNANERFAPSYSPQVRVHLRIESFTLPIRNSNFEFGPLKTFNLAWGCHFTPLRVQHPSSSSCSNIDFTTFRSRREGASKRGELYLGRAARPSSPCPTHLTGQSLSSALSRLRVLHYTRSRAAAGPTHVRQA